MKNEWISVDANRKKAGYLFIFFSIIFVSVETNYFGNNMTPQSLEELFCDMLSLSINFYGLYLLFTKPPKP